MPPLQGERAFFVHIPKTAGTSIYELFGMSAEKCRGCRVTKCGGCLSGWLRRGRQHRSLPELAAEGWMEPYQDWFRFSITRNPWDRMVSMYHYRLKRRASLSGFRRWLFSRLKPAVEEYFPPNEYVLNLSNRRFQWASPQYRFVYDEDMNLCVDFLARFENLQDDWPVICVKSGIGRRDLPHLNASSNRQRYRSYYDRESIEFIETYYKKDIEAFGYAY